MSDVPGDWLHIGVRELIDIEAERSASKPSVIRVLKRRGVGFAALGFGGSFTAPAAQDINEYELARGSAKWLPTSKASATLEDQILELPSPPVYIYGQAVFSIALYPKKLSSSNFTHSIIYASKVAIQTPNRQLSGLLVLVGSLRHSYFGPKNDSSATDWTPSTYEGLKYIIYLGKGGRPDEFDPISAFEDDDSLVDRIAAESLGLSWTAFAHPKDRPIQAQFAARIHTIIPRAAVEEESLRRYWYPAHMELNMPDVLIVGAPLWIYKGPESLVFN